MKKELNLTPSEACSGWVKDFRPNPKWREHQCVCQYEHCIEMMPLHPSPVPPAAFASCPLFAHKCPGGEEQVKECAQNIGTLRRQIDRRRALSDESPCAKAFITIFAEAEDVAAGDITVGIDGEWEVTVNCSWCGEHHPVLGRALDHIAENLTGDVEGSPPFAHCCLLSTSCNEEGEQIARQFVTQIAEGIAVQLVFLGYRIQAGIRTGQTLDEIERQDEGGST